MKHYHVYILLLLLAGAVSSCQKNEIEYENDFEKSYKAWQSFKVVSNNSYRYTVTASTWVGASWQTTLTVTNGKITRRHFKYTSLAGLAANIPKEAQEWVEDENLINLHQSTDAAEPLTLDEIYHTARNTWLTKRKDAKVFFEAKNDGLISSCGFVPDNCQDDCFTGINIGSIEML